MGSCARAAGIVALMNWPASDYDSVLVVGIKRP